MKNRGTEKLKKIIAKASEVREKAGFKLVPQKPKKVYNISQNEAVSIGTDILYGKNRSTVLDGVKKKSTKKATAKKVATKKKTTAKKAIAKKGATKKKATTKKAK